jgi:Na+-driven multidrug efflux pump
VACLTGIVTGGGDTRFVLINDLIHQWLIVIPASSLNADRTRALETFINGVGDIKIGIRAYSRQGN